MALPHLPSPLPAAHPALQTAVEEVLARVHQQRDAALYDTCVMLLGRARELGDHASFVRLADAFATVMDQRGQPQEGLELLREALTLARVEHWFGAQSGLLVQLGAVAYGRGEYLEALDAWTEAMEVAQRAGDTLTWGWAKLGLGQICDAFESASLAVGVFDELQQALRPLAEAGSPQDATRELFIAVHMNLGVNQMRLGQLEPAHQEFEAALELAQGWGALDAQAHAWLRLGEVALAREDLPTAEQQLAAAQDCATPCNFHWASAQIHWLQARLTLARDPTPVGRATAMRQTEPALQHARLAGVRHLEVQIERLRADLAEADGNAPRALHSLRQADALQRQMEQGSRSQALRDLEDLTGLRAGAERRLLELAAHPLVSSGDGAAALALLCEEGRTALRVDRLVYGAWLDGRWQPQHCAGGDPPSVGLNAADEIASGLRGRIEAGQAVVAQSTEHHQDTWHLHAAYFKPQGVQAVLMAPVQVSGQTVGVFFFEQRHQRRPWRREAPVLAMQLASIASRSLTTVERLRQEARIQQVNQELERLVEQRTQSLQQRNDDLARALDDLRNAQVELVRSGKLAALGGLVAGVAHELNTPIGNALMAANTLHEGARELQQRLEEGKLSRSFAVETASTLRRGAQMVELSLQRAAALVQSFKQVAVDQTSDQYREFILHDLIDEILLMLAPRLRKAGAQVRVQCDRALSMAGYPGPLGQVLTNLVDNAVMHGLDGRVNGHIDLAVETLPGDRLRLSVSDDGLGMGEAVLQRLFDPFFTTRMGRGGTGLGMTIAHNLVTGVLKGQLSVKSKVGHGSTFSLDLPRVLVAPSPEVGAAH